MAPPEVHPMNFCNYPECDYNLLIQEADGRWRPNPRFKGKGFHSHTQAMAHVYLEHTDEGAPRQDLFKKVKDGETLKKHVKVINDPDMIPEEVLLDLKFSNHCLHLDPKTHASMMTCRVRCHVL